MKTSKSETLVKCDCIIQTSPLFSLGIRSMEKKTIDEALNWSSCIKPLFV